jgi:hypothetical protein
MNEIIRQPIVDEMCKPGDQVCNRVIEGNLCHVYEEPNVWHRRGGCPMSSIEVVNNNKKKKVNPLKASRRKRRGR